MVTKHDYYPIGGESIEKENINFDHQPLCLNVNSSLTRINNIAATKSTTYYQIPFFFFSEHFPQCHIFLMYSNAFP